MQLPDSWLRISSTTLIAGGACVAILLGVYAAYAVGHQAYQRVSKSHQSWQTGRVHNAEGWRRMMQIKTAAQRETEQGDAPLIPFSPVDLQREGVRLVSWVPSAVGGEMSLEADWQQVPATFSMLAERGMQVIAFSLSPGNGALNFSLQLVRDDEP